MTVSADLMTRIESALRPHFPGDTVDVSPGYHDNAHVIVVSRKFDGMGEREKQDFLWGFIDKSDLSDEEKLKVSLILPYSPEELK